MIRIYWLNINSKFGIMKTDEKINRNGNECSSKSELKSNWDFIVGLIVPSPIQNLILVHSLLNSSWYWFGFSLQRWSVNVLVKWNVHVCEGLVENRIFYPQTSELEEISAMFFFWNVNKKYRYLVQLFLLVHFTNNQRCILRIFTGVSCLHVS